MISTNINGIDVQFPFEPYDIQKEYMSKVIECLSREQNGLLESPTGTGKTLSLLCASLAWLETKKTQFQLEQKTMLDKGDEFVKTLNDQLRENSGRTGKSFLGLPTIIYASRTHSQLSQAVSEMKLTAYNYMKACVIGSREQMCIHPQVVAEQNNQTKITLCNLKVKTRSCHFYNGLQRNKEELEFGKAKIVDIEDMISLGKKHKFCPYFMAKELKSSADIIFMPYNYLIEPKFRKNLGIQLANNIIILDEAHNIERVCEDSASFQIKSTDIALAIEEVTVAMKKLTEEPIMFDDEDIPKDFSAEDLIVLKQMLLDLEKEFDVVPINTGPEGTSFGGLFIFELLEKAGIKDGNNKIIINLLEKLVEYLSVTAGDNAFQRKGTALKLLEDSLRIIFAEVSNEYKCRIETSYKVHMAIEDLKFSKSSKTACKILNFWCLSPGFGMKMLQDEGIRCCILTSGTLAPLKPLITELEFTNPIHLENSHVIKDNQICVRIISNGPDNEKLSCTYHNRGNENYMRSLGSTIMNITRLIPNGLLIFFPSYPILNSCMNYWQKQGIWSNICQFKPIYTEPRDKVSFSNAMVEYYEKIKHPDLKGAIFMGVCRGKISEGLDFADNNGRAVLIVGLPYPPLKDPRVVLKKKYLDHCKFTNAEYIAGDKWYTLEACRAVNQAIGRVIRHKNDYGAILLLDERFNNYNIKSQLSGWLRNRIKPVQNFGELTRDLRLFFKNASEQLPLSNNSQKKNYVIQDEKSEYNQENCTPISNGTYNCFGFNSSENSINIGDSSASSCSNSINTKKGNLERYKRGIEKQISGITKRMKIRLIPNASNETSVPENEVNVLSEDTKEYIAMVRKAFDVETFKCFVSLLKSYQMNKNIEDMKAELDKIFYHDML
ncbi:hypothetical protein HHI36_009980 [Cryptolaemus montrouzieri]|uniref:Regulator of telomere elongation helicase 1 homolog n=1 Tax=Cryptolaemus montrouzieri TaxID=559131 RepID=A0ABD2MHT7_9CUCU